MKRLILVLAALRLSSVPTPAPAAADDGVWANPGGMYKNGSSRKIDSQILFPKEYDFPKTFSLTENQFSGKTYFYTIRPRGSDLRLPRRTRVGLGGRRRCRRGGGWGTDYVELLPGGDRRLRRVEVVDEENALYTPERDVGGVERVKIEALGGNSIGLN